MPTISWKRPLPHTPKGQLLNALRLQNNLDCYSLLLDSFRTIGRKHLNPRKTVKSQKNAFGSVAHELKVTFPDLFDEAENAEALRCAISYLKHWQSHNKCEILGRSARRLRQTLSSTKFSSKRAGRHNTDENYKSPQEKHKELLPSSQTIKPSKVLKLTPLRDRMARNLACYARQPAPTSMFTTPATSSGCFATWDSRDPSRYANTIAPKDSPPLKLESAGPGLLLASFAAGNISEPAIGLQPCQASSVLQTAPLGPQRQIDSSSSRCGPSALPQPRCSQSGSIGLSTTLPRPLHPITVVHRFLDSCLPSMSHYLQRFVDCGCTSEECLLSISTWDRRGIEDFLDKLPFSPGGAPMPFMDKMILLNRFATQFS